VEPLIGPGTVNTMPVETMNAYRDHGNPANRISEGLSDAIKLLDDLASAGIDLEAATRQLESEGLTKFNQPFDQLIQRISEIE
jgi:transaldolase/transaldolase/glucose-6-phosphate isomerase